MPCFSFLFPDFPIVSRAAAPEGQCLVEYRGYFARPLLCLAPGLVALARRIEGRGLGALAWRLWPGSPGLEALAWGSWPGDLAWGPYLSLEALA